MSGSSRIGERHRDGARMLACEELTKLVICGSDSDRSTVDVAAALGDRGARSRMSLRPRPSSSRKASPCQVPSGQVATMRAGLRFGGVEDGVDRGVHDPAPNSREKLRQPPLAEPRRADHRREVATEIAGIAGVGGEHVEQVVAQRAGLVEADGRDAQAFLPDLGGAGIVAAMRGAADVALVRAHDGPEQAALAPSKTGTRW